MGVKWGGASKLPSNIFSTSEDFSGYYVEEGQIKNRNVL